MEAGHPGISGQIVQSSVEKVQRGGSDPVQILPLFMAAVIVLVKINRKKTVLLFVQVIILVLRHILASYR